MKEVYVRPEMEVIEVETQELLAGSVFELNSDGYDSEEEVLAPETHYWEF